MDAVGASNIASGSDNSSVADAADDNGFTSEFGPPQQLARREERVHIDMDEAERAVGWAPDPCGLGHGSRRSARSSPGEPVAR